MKNLTFRKAFRFWPLLVLYLLAFAMALSLTIADAASAAERSREFWVWDLRVMPPAFRRAKATLRAQGSRSLIYVEDNLWGDQLNPYSIARMKNQLESEPPRDALNGEMGIVPYEEKVFGALPSKVTREDRLIVLFADLGQYKDKQFDGFYNSFDQLPEAEAFAKYQQHSNEANIIYLNGMRQNEAYTVGVVAHELQHLLAAGSGEVERESWLSESLAEGAMLLSGFFTDQGHVNSYVKNTGSIPLVTPSYVHYGPQLLFSSFLIDSLPYVTNTAIGALTRIQLPGRDAVEKLFHDATGSSTTFDLIFSNFVSYVFSRSENDYSLPTSWRHSSGISIPEIPAYYTFHSASSEMEGSVAPYSFVAIDLDQELSPTAVIQLDRSPGASNPGPCASKASVLWKPVNPNRIAIYAVGCDPGHKKETVPFHLRIIDRPSFLPPSAFKILP